jgi:carbon-monoxide dehydrogenase medium subunit
MKFPAFEYESPDTIGAAIALLGHHPDARVLAGGQSLLPLLAMRMSAPSHLIDLGRIPDLDAITASEKQICIGAMVKWRDIENNDLLQREHPLLVEAVSHIAHYQVRNLGTAGGALAYSDPASEMVCMAILCDAVIDVCGQGGLRIVRAEDFLLGPMTNALAQDEIITAVRFPRWPSGRRWAFQEFSRRLGDYAIAGVGLLYDEDENGRISNSQIALFGSLEKAVRSKEAEAVFLGRKLDKSSMNMAVGAAVGEIRHLFNSRLPPNYLQSLYGALLERALRQAAMRK